LFPKGDVFVYLDAHWYSDLPSAEEKEISAILRVNKVLTRRAIIASPEMENLAAVGIPSDAPNLELAGELMSPKRGLLFGQLSQGRSPREQREPVGLELEIHASCSRYLQRH
jgi:hypothetical protein